MRLASDPDASVAPFLVGGVLGAVLGPMIFYPWSKTIWTAFDLMLRPVSVEEPADKRSG